MLQSNSTASEERGAARKTQTPTRILVLGAGVAGLLFTLRLAGRVARKPVQITLVNESDTFIVRPKLHEFATNQHVFKHSLPQITRKARVQFLQARVISLDPGRRRVTVRDQQQQRELPYDYLVYALGSRIDVQGVPGSAQYAYSIQMQGQLSAAALRDRLPTIDASNGRVIVCGGGATGIETATQIASVYPHIKVSIVTRGKIAPTFSQKVYETIRHRLLSLGVEIRDQSEVRAVRAQSILLDQGRELPCSLCIWAGGFMVQPLGKEAGLAVNARDQILVDPFLRSVSHPQIYAIGDAASPVEKPGVEHVRMSAFTASVMAAHGADCLGAVLKGAAPKPLSFVYLAQAVALGQHSGIFFPLSADDKPVPPYIAGRLGAMTRNALVSFVITAALAQRRFPAMFTWLGKRRYEQAKRDPGAVEEHLTHSVHRVS